MLLGHALVALLALTFTVANGAHWVLISLDTRFPPGSSAAYSVEKSTRVSDTHVARRVCSNDVYVVDSNTKQSDDTIVDVFLTRSTDETTARLTSLSDKALRECHKRHHMHHHHDHLAGHDGSLGGGRVENMILHFPLVIPESVDATSVMLYARGDATATRRVQHALSYTSSSLLQMQQRGINVTTVQQINPYRTRSITFVSAGYVAADQSLFNSHVAGAVSALRGLSAAVTAVPWPRYISLINMYSVFEPSAQSGASRPQGPNHECSTMTICGPTSVANNLGCAYGTPTPSLISCDRAAVQSLASFAPVSDIIVTLINDVDYGGTGGGGIATVIGSSTFLPFLIVHELNHAVAGLGDEYSYGFSDTATLPNCAATNDASLVPWASWIQAKKADTSPSPGCTFDNLFRPTAAGCLMHSSTQTAMCQVCRETLTSALYSGGIGLALDEPRCPPAGFDIFVDPAGSATLTVNHRFTIYNPLVNISWRLPDGTVLFGIPSVSISGSQLTAGANIVTVTILDLTSDLKSWTQVSGTNYTTTFTLRRLATTTNCSTLQCKSSLDDAYTYCGTCTTGTAGGGCGTDVLVKPVTYTSSSGQSIEQAQKNIFIVATVVACTGFGILLILVILWCCCNARYTQPVLHLTSGDQTLLRLSVVSSIVVLCLVSIVLVFAVKYFPQTVMFGNEVFISLLVIGSFVFLVAVVNVVATVARWTIVMWICAFFILLISLGMFAVGVFSLYVRENYQTQSLRDSFAQRWKDQVTSNPSLICSIESALDCSGYYHGCFPVPSSYCPVNCDLPNQNPNSCENVFNQWINDKLFPVAIACLVCAFFFVVAAFISSLSSTRIRRARNSGQSRRTYRKDSRAPVPAITDPEITQFREEFAKTDKSGTGYLRGEELATFVKDIFEEDLAPEEKMALQTAGPMNADQVLKLYFPHMESGAADPRQLTTEEAEEATDPVHLQQLQYAKMELFMIASGSLSPEALYHLYRDYRKVSFTATGREFIDVMRQAAKDHDRTEEADMCRGLSPQELEGLRCAWVSIHPQVVGTLSDNEIDRFYQWTHGSVLHTHEQFVRWRELLDVRGTGEIGWAEFCMPFSQRALVKKARDYLSSINRSVDPEMLTRGEVAEEFGPVIVDMCFLPHEKLIPVERALEVAMRFQY